VGVFSCSVSARGVSGGPSIVPAHAVMPRAIAQPGAEEIQRAGRRRCGSNGARRTASTRPATARATSRTNIDCRSSSGCQGCLKRQKHWVSPRGARCKQLTGLDAASSPWKRPMPRATSGGCPCGFLRTTAALTLARLTDVMADRLPLVPVLRSKRSVQLGVDQRTGSTTRTSTSSTTYSEYRAGHGRARMAQLTEQVAPAHARPLDRSLPLWRLPDNRAGPSAGQACTRRSTTAAIDGVSGEGVVT